MIHECNRALEQVWSAAASGRNQGPSPSPAQFGYAFLARRWDESHYIFSRVGQSLSLLHGRRLLDQNLLGLWRVADRRVVRAALSDAMRLRAPLIIRTRGRRLDGGSIAFEGTFWPLEGPGANVEELLGALAPCVGACGDRPVVEHAVDEITLLPGQAGDHAPRSRGLIRLLMSDGAC